MKDIYIADLGKFENQPIVSFFAVSAKQLRSRKDGGQYLALTLADRTGQTECRMWENFADCLSNFEQGDVVKVRGGVSRYNGKLQLTLDKVRAASPDEFQLVDFVPHTSKDVEELWSQLVQSVDSFTEPSLKALIRSFLDDPALPRLFAKRRPPNRCITPGWAVCWNTWFRSSPSVIWLLATILKSIATCC